MTTVGPVLGIVFLLALIALSGRRLLEHAACQRPQPIRLEDVADGVARGLLAAAKDPTLHPAVAAELRAGVLAVTALRTAGLEETAARLLREIQSVHASRSVDEAAVLATKTRQLLADLPAAPEG